MKTDKLPSDSTRMRILLHHIYEFNKGLRNLVLHTMKISERSYVEKVLSGRGISFHIQQANDRLINVFFGQPDCVKIIKSFGDKKLSHLTPEQDFMLGTMLGYCRMQQCERYLKKTAPQKSKIFDVA